MTRKHHSKEEPSAPWWSYGHVWMVIGGPAVVVVAALFTGWIAISSPDPVLTGDAYRQAQASASTAPGKSTMPALQGRNHAASPEPAPAP